MLSRPENQEENYEKKFITQKVLDATVALLF